jgi:hypothetical protein
MLALLEERYRGAYWAIIISLVMRTPIGVCSYAPRCLYQQQAYKETNSHVSDIYIVVLQWKRRTTACAFRQCRDSADRTKSYSVEIRAMYVIDRCGKPHFSHENKSQSMPGFQCVLSLLLDCFCWDTGRTCSHSLEMKLVWAMQPA